MLNGAESVMIAAREALLILLVPSLSSRISFSCGGRLSQSLIDGGR